MTRLLPTTAAALALTLSLPAAAFDADTSARLTCNVSGMYADGTRIAGSGSEDVAIEIRRGGSSDIRVSSNGRTRQAALLRSTPERLAFVYAADALVDGYGMTLSLLYEIRLDNLRLKRTATPLFTSQVGPLQSAESNCVRTSGAAVAPGTTPTAPAGPTPDWLVEFRRKLKECGTKDPISQMTCTERMKARYCTNRPAGIPECDN
jgi:hypothetical protein